MSMYDRPLVMLDFETTGLSPDMGDRITEVAALRIEGGQITDRYVTLINCNARIPAFITGLTGITQAMVDHAETAAGVSTVAAAALQRRALDQQHRSIMLMRRQRRAQRRVAAAHHHHIVTSVHGHALFFKRVRFKRVRLKRIRFKPLCRCRRSPARAGSARVRTAAARHMHRCARSRPDIC